MEAHEEMFNTLEYLQHIICHFHQPPALRIHLSDQEGAGCVAMKPVQEDRDINIDDIAVDKGPRVGNPVTDDFIDAGADALGKVSVVERRWVLQGSNREAERLNTAERAASLPPLQPQFLRAPRHQSHQ